MGKTGEGEEVMDVKIYKMKLAVQRLERQRDALLKSRDIEKLPGVLDSLDQAERELWAADPDSRPTAHNAVTESFMRGKWS
jgi:hypothetical protein